MSDDGFYVLKGDLTQYLGEGGNVVIPDSVVCINDYAFCYCGDKLTSVTFPAGLTRISYKAFDSCTRLTSLELPDSVISIGAEAFYDTGYYQNESNWEDGVLYIGKHLIKADECLSGAYKVKEGTITIADNAFDGCTELTSITLPESLRYIGESAFCQCEALESIIIPEGVTSIPESAFQDCTSLSSVVIPDSVTSIGRYAFGFCKSITSVTMSAGIKDIELNAFEDCEALETVNITDIAAWCEINFEEFEANPVFYSKKLFVNGELLTDLVVPESVVSINRYAFCDCEGLTSVAFHKGVNHIGEYSFSGCSALNAVHITDIASWNSICFDEHNPLMEAENLYLKGELVTELVFPDGTKKIGDNALSMCRNLTSVVIPQGVEVIGSSAFRRCADLISVTIPDSVIRIEKDAFFDCTGLEEVLYTGSVYDWEKIEISTGNDALNEADIYYL